jgi:phytoene dehydrogenase-like protein
MAHDPTHESDTDPAPTTTDVVVVGGGLAGLSAATVAARSGAEVTVLDTRQPGGRAATTVVEPGVTFNSGPRALYLGGAMRRVLRELGIDPTGGTPPTRGGCALRDGVLHPMPAGPVTLLRTRLLSVRSKVKVGALLARIDAIDPVEHAQRSGTEWMAQAGLAEDARELVAMLARTATYVADLDLLSADAMLTQMQMALDPGVRYLDGGFQQIVDALRADASSHGVTVRDHAAVTTIDADPSGRGWLVHTGAGSWSAAAVVLASGSPESVQRLSPVALDLSGLGPAATASCLELAVRGDIAQPIVLGVGASAYLSVHQPPADLAPAGMSVVHAMRYGATERHADEAALWRLASIGGIERDRVVAHRFLARMVVTGGIPIAARGGLAGRPGVRVPGVDGLFLAGDWVGPEGMLADAAVSSGAVAGRAGAEAARAVRTVSGVTAG